MKKIGILTLSASDNCGSLLQAYALQMMIEKNNCKAEIIDFESVLSKDMYDIIPYRFWKHPKRTLKSFLNYKKLKHQKDDYNFFRDNYLHLTAEHYLGEEAIKAIDGKYDTLVVGSDQVWNIKMADFDHAFMLDWVTKMHKVAYAPSLGGSDFSTYLDKERLKDNLNSYKKLSTREINGQKAIENVINKKVPVLADPTLLLMKEEWCKIVGDRIVENNYIFYYSWAYNNDYLNRIVEQYAKQKGLKVYVINASKWLNRKPKKYGFNLCEASGPQTFLNLMNYADKVFVESFHGVIFANIFEKDFFFLNNYKDGSLDPRLDSILELFHRKDRVICNYSDIKDVSIDYSIKNEEFDSLRKESIEYLKDSLA